MSDAHQCQRQRQCFDGHRSRSAHPVFPFIVRSGAGAMAVSGRVCNAYPTLCAPSGRRWAGMAEYLLCKVGYAQRTLRAPSAEDGPPIRPAPGSTPVTAGEAPRPTAPGCRLCPSIGRRYGGVEGLVRVVEPGRTGVVQVGEGPLLQLGLMPRFGDDPIGVAGDDLRDPFHPRGRVQPGFAQCVQAVGGGSNREGRPAPAGRHGGRIAPDSRVSTGPAVSAGVRSG